MDGKELLKLLDLVKGYRETEDRLKKEAEEAGDTMATAKLKAKAEGYNEVSKKLEYVLREMNH